MELDTTQIGILGKHLLIDKLMLAGFEVAEPIRDRGIDLIAYIDGKGKAEEEFNAWPIQLKSAKNRIFSLAKKYEKLKRLLIVYAWNVDSRTKSRLFVLTYKEAEKILIKRGYAKTPSWKKENGKWDTTRFADGGGLEEDLKDYEVKSREDLVQKLFSVR